MLMKCNILVPQCFYFTSNPKIIVERKNVVSALMTFFALNVEVMQIHSFTKKKQFRTRTFTVLLFEIKPNIFQIVNRRNKTKGKLIF